MNCIYSFCLVHVNPFSLYLMPLNNWRPGGNSFFVHFHESMLCFVCSLFYKHDSRFHCAFLPPTGEILWKCIIIHLMDLIRSSNYSSVLMLLDSDQFELEVE